MNFLVLHQALELFLAAVIQKKNVIGKTVFHRQDDRVEVQSDETQFSQRIIEQDVGRDGVDDDVEGVPLAGPFYPLLGMSYCSMRVESKTLALAVPISK